MMNMKTLGGAALLLAACLAAHGADDYAVRLECPRKKGDTFQWDANVTSTSRLVTTIEGKESEKKLEESIKFKAVMTVLEVDGNGNPTKLSCRIESFICRENDTSKQVLAKGTVVTATAKEGRPVFETDDTPVAEEAGTKLGYVVPVHTSPTALDDLFGTRERQKVGGTWEVNKESCAEYMGRILNVKVAPEGVTGSVTLKDVTKVGSTKCLKVVLKGTVTGSVPEPLPPLKSCEVTMEIDRSEELPIEASAVERRSSLKVHRVTEAVVSATDVEPAKEMVHHYTMENNATALPVKKARSDRRSRADREGRRR